MRFLEKTAQKLLVKHGTDLSQVLVLMPNRRSGTYLRNELAAQAEQTVIAPEIDTLQNAMLRLSTWVVSDEIDLLAELYRCHRQIGGALSLDEFIGIGRMMLSDFEELDTQLTDTKSFFHHLEALKSMNVYEPGKPLTEYQIQYKLFWKEFGLLYDSLRRVLSEKHSGYRGMILRQVAESKELMDGLPAYEAIYLVGFSGLTASDAAFISYLKHERQAEVFCDSDSYYVKDAMNEAGYFFRKHRGLFGLVDADLPNEILSRKKSIELVGSAKNMGQVKVAADILLHRLKVDEKSALDTVIILPDEKLLLPLLAHLPAAIPSVNMTMGISMNRSLTAVWIENLFSLYEGAQRFRSSNNRFRFYFQDVFALLQHPFIRMIDEYAKPEDFMLKMKKYNRVAISDFEITSELGTSIGTVFVVPTDLNEYLDSLQKQLQYLQRRLIDSVKHGQKSLAAEVEILHRLRNIITGTRKLVDLPGGITIATFIHLIRETISNERVTVEGDPVQGLQMMGLQETRSLDFKNVLILSANEGILPSGKSMQTFIPFALRKQFLSTHLERDAVTAYLLNRLLHQAEQVFVLYNTEPDELGGGDKSRFMQQWLFELNSKQVSVQEKIFAVDPPPPLPEPEIVVTKSNEVMDKLHHLLGSSGLSPSALNTYINCSLQYYFRYIAGIREQEEMEESMEAATVGSAVHYALEQIFKPCIGQAIDVAHLEIYLKDISRIEALITDFLKERFDEESLRRGKNLLLYKVCVQLTENFLKAEKARVEHTATGVPTVKIIGLEEKLKQAITLGGREIFFTGRTDRIEQVGDVIRIADYKTTKSDTIPILTEAMWELLMEDPKYAKSVQLLMYAWLYSRSHSGNKLPISSGIYWLRKNEVGLDTISISKGDDIIREENLLKFEQILFAKIQEMLDVAVPFTKTEDKKHCTYCDFAKICGRE